MTECYLTTLPREFMRGVADFDPDYRGSYFLPRAPTDLPRLLLEKVWPAADGWYAAHLQLPNASKNLEPNLTGGTFLELLLKLKTVFLQVSALFFYLKDFS